MLIYFMPWVWPPACKHQYDTLFHILTDFQLVILYNPQHLLSRGSAQSSYCCCVICCLIMKREIQTSAKVSVQLLIF